MPLSNHIDALQAKHEFLEHMIRAESLRPSPDFVALTELKKSKLAIKEEMQRCMQDLPRADSA